MALSVKSDSEWNNNVGHTYISAGPSLVNSGLVLEGEGTINE